LCEGYRRPWGRERGWLFGERVETKPKVETELRNTCSRRLWQLTKVFCRPMATDQAIFLVQLFLKISVRSYFYKLLIIFKKLLTWILIGKDHSVPKGNQHDFDDAEA
jgi:hypothetical protein